MLTLEAVKKFTDDVFNNKMVLPEPEILWKDKIEALKEASLGNHKTSCIFDMRNWQAQKLGFQRLHSTELVEMLMGEKHSKQTQGTARQKYEYVYNHHTDSLENDEGWEGNPEVFDLIVKKGLWYYPPFAEVKKWSCQFGKLNYLKRDIPYGVVLRINECKELKLFNCFNVLAPMEAWERKTDIDPIVVATIWEIPPKESGKGTAGQVAHYFLAQW